jgi:hypothetical protein
MIPGKIKFDPDSVGMILSKEIVFQYQMIQTINKNSCRLIK